MATKTEQRALKNTERLKKEKDLQEELIVKMKNEGLSLARIAQATGRSRTGARDVLVRNGAATS